MKPQVSLVSGFTLIPLPVLTRTFWKEDIEIPAMRDRERVAGWQERSRETVACSRSQDEERQGYGGLFVLSAWSVIG